MNRDTVTDKYNHMQDAIQAYVDAEKQSTRDFVEEKMASPDTFWKLSAELVQAREYIQKLEEEVKELQYRQDLQGTPVIPPGLTVNVAGEEWTREFEAELDDYCAVRGEN